MSKQKKSNKKKRSSSSTLSDITINDFANSAIISSRSKKAASSVTSAVILKNIDEDKSWDDDTKDYDGEFVPQEDADGSVTYVIHQKEQEKSLNRISTTETGPAAAGNQYNHDVWFLISEYIRPEDVKTFAGICKYANDVVSTAKFWLNLYKRYYKDGCKLPDSLKPDRIVRKYGLRMNVIRALHYMYPPFAARLKSVESSEQHPEVFKRSRCVLMWQQKVKQHYLYYFKMSANQLPTMSSGSMLDILDDIYANKDEGCRILLITCKNMIPVAPVLGLTLVHVHLNLSSELRYYKLHLWFGSKVGKYNPSLIGSSENTVVTLEPVIGMRILDWWHPLYPYNHNIEYLLNEEYSPYFCNKELCL